MSSSDFHNARLLLPLYVSSRDSVYQKWISLGESELSEGRLSFETSKRLSVDSACRLIASGIPGLPEAASIHGRVVYRKNLGHGRYRIGIEFTTFVNVSREEIFELLAHMERPRMETEWEPTPTPSP